MVEIRTLHWSDGPWAGLIRVRTGRVGSDKAKIKNGLDWVEKLMGRNGQRAGVTAAFFSWSLKNIEVTRKLTLFNRIGARTAMTARCCQLHNTNQIRAIIGLCSARVARVVAWTADPSGVA